MRFAAMCCSHAPLVLRMPAADKDGAFAQTMAGAGEWVRAFDPELVIQFAPDHFNGFFYDAMPNFCIGAVAESIGDWDTAKGPLPVPTELALAAVNAARAADVDVDLSYQMRVDHGFTQMWEMMSGRIDAYPIVPIMINCAAPPRPPFRRARLLGEAIGRFAAGLGKRVLFAGSGGLSHDPPMPNMTTNNDGARQFFLDGRNPSAEAREAREARVVAAAEAFAAGKSAARAPNAAWDAAFMELLESNRLEQVDSWSEDEVTALGGGGGHEVRAWIAAYAALAAAAGPYRSTRDYYSVITEWMTGMGAARAAPAAAGALAPLR